MPMRLDSESPDFESRFKALLATKREVSEDVDATVREIVREVRADGDAALIRLSQRFDRVDLGTLGLRVTTDEIKAAKAACRPEDLAALRLAHERIASFHARQVPEDLRFTDSLGVELGWRWTAIQAVGLYVPGGTAAYPSSVLMNAVPAKVVGCERLVMVVPAPDGRLNPLVLAAAELAGVDEVYRVGGAQAIAALAYGTETIAPVMKIMGPGNAYVAAAKRQVFGTVGIDMIAGPSEVLILADRSADPAWVAADLLAQAEHDEAAQSILITDDSDLAEAVEREVEIQLSTLPRQAIAGASWRDFGAILHVPSLEAAVPLADRLAPEHLEIIAVNEEALAAAIRNAGAIFLGAHTPEAVGDYVGGSNHVLPTARSARFSSGLNVLDFMKKTSILKCSEASLHKIGPAAVTLGEAEGLGAHARSVAMRLGQRPRRSSAGGLMTEDKTNRLKSVVLDGDSIGIGTPDQEHERQIAVYDLIEENVFALPGKDAGPYDLTISLHEAKLMLDIAGADGEQKAVHILSLTPFRRILRDYFMICESYYDAIRTQTAAQIEAIDMGRRGLHNEGADLLLERLSGKIDCDNDTARRLFTLITALHWKG